MRFRSASRKLRLLSGRLRLGARSPIPWPWCWTPIFPNWLPGTSRSWPLTSTLPCLPRRPRAPLFDLGPPGHAACRPRALFQRRGQGLPPARAHPQKAGGFPAPQPGRAEPGALGTRRFRPHFLPQHAHVFPAPACRDRRGPGRQSPGSLKASFSWATPRPCVELSQSFHLRHTHDTFYYQLLDADSMRGAAEKRAAAQARAALAGTAAPACFGIPG